VRILGHRWGGFLEVRYAAQGRKLLTGRSHGPVLLWDLTTFAREQELAGQAYPVSRLFAPGGERFLKAHGQWNDQADLPTVFLPGQPAPDPPQAPALWEGLVLTFGPDGCSVLRQSWERSPRASSRLVLFGLDGAVLRAFVYGEKTSLSCAAFSPDGSLLVGSQSGSTVLLWDAAGGERLGELDHSGFLGRVRFSCDGRLLATAVGRTVRLWDVADRQCQEQFPAFRTQVQALAFSPDGRLLAAGSRDGHLRIWEVAGGSVQAELNWGVGSVHALAFAPDGATAAATGSEGRVVVWDVDL
jgi:WD40 repeat protein